MTDIESNTNKIFRRKCTTRNKIIFGSVGMLSLTGMIAIIVCLTKPYQIPYDFVTSTTYISTYPIKTSVTSHFDLQTSHLKHRENHHHNGGRICNGYICQTITPSANGDININNNNLGG